MSYIDYINYNCSTSKPTSEIGQVEHSCPAFCEYVEAVCN